MASVEKIVKDGGTYRPHKMGGGTGPIDTGAPLWGRSERLQDQPRSTREAWTLAWELNRDDLSGTSDPVLVAVSGEKRHRKLGLRWVGNPEPCADRVGHSCWPRVGRELRILKQMMRPLCGLEHP